jgi:hypothetical protein
MFPSEGASADRSQHTDAPPAIVARRPGCNGARPTMPTRAEACAPAVAGLRLGRRVTTDPHSGRATERYANAAYCRLAGGASVEAHLARVAAHALPEHMTQLDHLYRWGLKACMAM